MDKEYIEREALMNFANNHKSGTIDANDIARFPIADVVDVRHGEWKAVYSNNMGIVYECSECGHLTFGTSDYCICGAKMDG